jgi:hypothetical protein
MLHFADADIAIIAENPVGIQSFHSIRNVPSSTGIQYEHK